MTARVTRFDVLVVGLGPAGATAARAAAAAGVRTLALDRRTRAGAPVQCAELVPGLIGQDVDLGPDAVLQAVRGMRTFVERDPPDVTTPFPGYMIDRSTFDRQQVEAAQHAGAECRLNTSVRSIDADGVVTTAGGERIAARLVIGADGPGSIVGRAVGRTNRDVIYARQVTVPLRDAHDATDIFLSARVPGGYGWLFPKRDHANVGVGVTARHRGRLKALLGELLATLQAAGRTAGPPANETGGAIPAGGLLEPGAALADCPVLLAGDAAGLANPVTGAGIHAALVSGRLAGEAAAAWLAGEAAALPDYAEELQELFGASLDRALLRRRDLLDRFAAGRMPCCTDLRRGWIAYPAYWAADAGTVERNHPGVLT